jgi:hypothetical protein
LERREIEGWGGKGRRREGKGGMGREREGKGGKSEGRGGKGREREGKGGYGILIGNIGYFFGKFLIDSKNSQLFYAEDKIQWLRYVRFGHQQFHL